MAAADFHSDDSAVRSGLTVPPDSLKQLMIADRRNIESSVNSQPGPAWANSWHLWKVFLPRRSITGRLVWGTVWRRQRGRGWTYKKFIEYSEDKDQ
jgi:hypothetical protein